MMLGPGEYRLYTSKRLILPDITAAISEKALYRNELQVYPNPVKGMLYLEPSLEYSRLTVLNSAGQVVKSPLNM